MIIVGDIHAQLTAIFHILKDYGNPEDNKYGFIGIYVDREPKSLSTITLLLAYKIKIKDNFIMIGENHEDVKVSASSNHIHVIFFFNFPKSLNAINNLFSSLIHFHVNGTASLHKQ